MGFIFSRDLDGVSMQLQPTHGISDLKHAQSSESITIEEGIDLIVNILLS